MSARLIVGWVGVCLMAAASGCTSSGAAQAAPRAAASAAHAEVPAPVAASPLSHETARTAEDRRSPPPDRAMWIGAAAESDMLLSRSRQSVLGIWVDVPEALRSRVHAPVDLALVIDTSGSMEGEKIQAARASARALVTRLEDGDIVSIDTFADAARVLLPPTVITPATRRRALSAIDELQAEGSTNMAAGIELAGSQLASAPDDHPVRRVVLVSDGQANVGLSSPEALGRIAAEYCLRLGGQVTSLGVGLDYDEKTLDAIAERTSGRLFHVGDPREMEATLDREMALLASTVASDAVLEVVPAPGVRLVGVEGAEMRWSGAGKAEIALGALFPGQHREALVRVELDDLGPAPGTQRVLASVRLRFRDPSEGGVERVQEVLAHVSTTDDPAAAASHANPRTHAMMATLEASKAEILAAQAMGAGDYAQAQARLDRAEQVLHTEAAATRDEDARRKIAAAAQSVAAGRAAAAGAPAAAPTVVRERALEMNKAGMGLAGY